MTAADRVLHIAAAENGYHETGVNHTKFGRAFGWDGVPWCAIFVWWCFDQAGLAHLLPEKTASAPGLAEAFRRAGRFGHTPRKGAVTFFDLNFNGGIDHVGLCVARLADGRIKTDEGNSGDEVDFHYRSPSLIAGYGYPDYAQEDDDVKLTDKVATSNWIERRWPHDPYLKDGMTVAELLENSYGNARVAKEASERLEKAVADLAKAVAELKAKSA